MGGCLWATPCIQKEHMKKILIGFLVLVPAMIAIAGGSFAVSIVNQISTATTASQASVEGFIESIYVDVTGTTTGALSIRDSKGYVIFTNASITADTMFYPRVAIQTQAGAAVTGTGQWDRVYLDGEPLTFTLTETAPVTNAYIVTVRVSR